MGTPLPSPPRGEPASRRTSIPASHVLHLIPFPCNILVYGASSAFISHTLHTPESGRGNDYDAGVGEPAAPRKGRKDNWK